MQKYEKPKQKAEKVPGEGESEEEDSQEEEEEEEIGVGPEDVAFSDEPAKFIFFDFETTQDKKIYENQLGPVNLHQANLCVVQRACDICKEKPDLKNVDCKVCGKRQLIFRGKDTVKEFCQWLFSKENKKKCCHCPQL